MTRGTIQRTQTFSLFLSFTHTHTHTYIYTCRGYLVMTEEGKARLKEANIEGAYLGPDGRVHIPGKKVTLYSEPSPPLEELQQQVTILPLPITHTHTHTFYPIPPLAIMRSLIHAYLHTHTHTHTLHFAFAPSTVFVAGLWSH